MYLGGLSTFCVFSIISAVIKVSLQRLTFPPSHVNVPNGLGYSYLALHPWIRRWADYQNRVGLCVLRAICGLGLAVASPAGFGIVGVTFKYEPQKTIAFSAFGLGAPLGAACGTLIGGAIAATGE